MLHVSLEYFRLSFLSWIPKPYLDCVGSEEMFQPSCLVNLLYTLLLSYPSNLAALEQKKILANELGVRKALPANNNYAEVNTTHVKLVVFFSAEKGWTHCLPL